MCARCDSQCETCVDKGNVGDRKVCLTCAEGYNFFFPDAYECVGPDCTGSCLIECPVGMYNGGFGICQYCDEDCRTCSFSASNCKSCDMSGPKAFLLDNKCIEQCPVDHGNIAGVCFACESPCATCGTGPNVCTSCDGTDGKILNYGPTCVDTCPLGFLTNAETGECEGCGAGCFLCDPID